MDSVLDTGPSPAAVPLLLLGPHCPESWAHPPGSAVPAVLRVHSCFWGPYLEDPKSLSPPATSTGHSSAAPSITLQCRAAPYLSDSKSPEPGPRDPGAPSPQPPTARPSLAGSPPLQAPGTPPLVPGPHTGAPRPGGCCTGLTLPQSIEACPPLPPPQCRLEGSTEPGRSCSPPASAPILTVLSQTKT